MSDGSTSKSPAPIPHGVRVRIDSPLFWCKPSTFCVMIRAMRPRCSSRAKARWAAAWGRQTDDGPAHEAPCPVAPTRALGSQEVMMIDGPGALPLGRHRLDSPGFRLMCSTPHRREQQRNHPRTDAVSDHRPGQFLFRMRPWRPCNGEVLQNEHPGSTGPGSTRSSSPGSIALFADDRDPLGSLGVPLLPAG